jgi:hypothetical protein
MKNSIISDISARLTEWHVHDHSVPWDSLVLYINQPASPTGWTSRYKRLVTRDGRLFEARPGQAFPQVPEGRVTSEWLDALKVALVRIGVEPAEQMLKPPPNAGPAPTCNGTYHEVYVHRGLFGQVGVHIADFDFTKRALPAYVNLLMAPRLEKLKNV